MTSTGVGTASAATSTGHRAIQPVLDRFALPAFVAYLAVAFVVLLIAGRDDWFSGGDWNLINGPATRDIFLPVEQHWTTVPLLVFQGLFLVFGLNYTPYLVTAVAIHLTIAALVRSVARRAGVRPWIATLLAAPIVLFAPGYLSVLMPIQITQNLSLAFGLGQLLLADHEGRDRRRDALALGAGVLGVMSSGIMPALVLGTGVALLLRRGWRAAAVQTVPLGLLFVAWYRWQDAGATNIFFQAPSYDLARHLRFVADGFAETFWALGSSSILAAALGIVLLAGLVVRLTAGPFLAQVRAVAAPLALLLAAVAYLGIVGYQRSSLDDYAGVSHHLYNVAVLALPALAVAVGALVGRWRVLAPVAVGLVLVCVAANIRFQQDDRALWFRSDFLQTARATLVTAVNDPELDAKAAANPDAPVLPGELLSGIRFMSYRWLIEARGAGRVPTS